MKRIAAFLTALTMAVSLAACAGNQPFPSSTGSTQSSLTVTDHSSSTPSESTSQSESSSAPEQSSESEPEESSSGSSQEPASSGSQSEGSPADDETASSQPESVSDAPEETGGPKVLVAYFSATNTTKGVAETIAASTGGDLYAITPAQPYTSADLNYNDDNSRSTKEMNDPSARPEISGSVADMAQYDIVFLGYPIWWGEAPRIINTFVESYDLSGKTIVPFCTSGGSGMGSSATNLQSAASGASWLSGRRLNSGVSQSEIAQWVNGLELGISAE